MHSNGTWYKTVIIISAIVSTLSIFLYAAIVLAPSKYSPQPIPTVVTAYYALRSHASSTQYLERVERLLRSLRGNLVMYTAADMLDKLREMVKPPLNVHFVVCPEENWRSTLLYPPGFWERQNISNPTMSKFYYEKKEFVKKAMKSDPFQSGLYGMFLWIDAGHIRTEFSEQLVRDLHKNAGARLEMDRTLLQLSGVSGSGVKCSSSALLGGGRASWLRYIRFYARTFQDMLSTRSDGGIEDRHILESMASLHPRYFLTLRHDNNCDHLVEYLCAGNTQPARSVRAHYIKPIQQGRNSFAFQMTKAACVLGVSRATNRVAILPPWKHGVEIFPNYARLTACSWKLQRRADISIVNIVGQNVAVSQADHLSLGFETGPLVGCWEPHAENLIRNIFEVCPSRAHYVRAALHAIGIDLDVCVAVNRGMVGEIQPCEEEYYTRSILHVLELCSQLNCVQTRKKPKQVILVSHDVMFCRRMMSNMKTLNLECFISPFTSPAEKWLAYRLAAHRVLSPASDTSFWFAAYLATVPGNEGVTITCDTYDNHFTRLSLRAETNKTAPIKVMKF